GSLLKIKGKVPFNRTVTDRFKWFFALIQGRNPPAFFSPSNWTEFTHQLTLHLSKERPCKPVRVTPILYRILFASGNRCFRAVARFAINFQFADKSSILSPRPPALARRSD